MYIDKEIPITLKLRIYSDFDKTNKVVRILKRKGYNLYLVGSNSVSYSKDNYLIVIHK